MKFCTRCATLKPHLDFYRNKNCEDGYRNVCKACGKAWRDGYHEKNSARISMGMAAYREANKERLANCQKRYREANAEKLAAQKRQRTTGFSPDMFIKTLSTQKYKCAICDIDLTKLAKQKVHADHCHKTKNPRGVLCQECNTGLGKFKDDSAMLRRAAEYLDNPPTKKGIK